MAECKLTNRQWALKQFINDCSKEEVTLQKIISNFPGVYEKILDLIKDLIAIIEENKYE